MIRTRDTSRIINIPFYMSALSLYACSMMAFLARI